jgi:hypothetical protein
MVKPDDPCIHRFESLTGEYKVIFTDFKIDDYNSNVPTNIKQLTNECRFPIVYVRLISG